MAKMTAFRLFLEFLKAAAKISNSNFTGIQIKFYAVRSLQVARPTDCYYLKLCGTSKCGLDLKLLTVEVENHKPQNTSRPATPKTITHSQL